MCVRFFDYISKADIASCALVFFLPQGLKEGFSSALIALKDFQKRGFVIFIRKVHQNPCFRQLSVTARSS